MRAVVSAVACSLLVSASLAFAPAPALGVVLPSGFQQTTVFEGLDEPTALQFSGDGRVFVAEKAGIIKVYDGIADQTPQVFADLRTAVYDGGDRGILGLALDPEFPARPYVYLLYSHDAPIEGTAPFWGEEDEAGDACPNPPGSNTDGCVTSGRLSRLTAVGNKASDEEVLVEDWCQQFPSHSIGDLHFGADGALYASGGDGASYSVRDYGQFGYPKVNPCGDPPGGVGGVMAPPSAEGGALRSQDLRTPATPADPTGLDGTIIRIDPDTGEGWPGNPMEGSLDANEQRIVAYGFRNPFRFAIHPETNEVYVGNVGQGSYEELDRFASASTEIFNSGWPCFEGDIRPYKSVGLSLCESLYAEEPKSNPAPFFAYHHSAGVFPSDTCPHADGSAFSGIAFYDGGAFPAPYEGALFFADSVRGCIYVMFPGDDGRPDPSTVAPFLSDVGPYPGIDIEVGPDGNLYYVSIVTEAGGEIEPGAVRRISYFSGNQPPVAHLVADKQWGEDPLPVEFNATGSSDADDDQLEYEWDLDGDGIFTPPTSTGVASETYLDEENYIATVRVSDGSGASSVARLTIYPGNTPPQPEIATPTEALEWAVGEDIEFSGGAEDGEDDELPSTSLDWSARLFHCPAEGCHAHSLQAFPGVDSGSFSAPDHGHPSRIELTLTAVDSRGLAAKETVTIHPRAVELAIESDPPGVELEAGLLSKAAPFALTAIEGANVTLSAPASTQLEGGTYNWQGWSDGGARVHTVVADQPATYVATFEPAAPAVTNLDPDQGPTAGGNQVTIAGTDLGGATEVEFGDNPAASFMVEGHTQITVPNAPAGAVGTVDVTVTTAAGSSATSGSGNDYTYEVPPSCTSFTPDHGPAAGGNQVAITGADLGSVTKVEFGSTVVSPPFAENSATSIKLNAPAHVAGGVLVKVTTAGGTATCSGGEYTYSEEEDEGKVPGGDSGGLPLQIPSLGDIPPRTRIDARPKRRTRSSTARFAFSASSPGAAFFCKLNGGPYVSSRSPHVYRNLKPGRHVFRVAAVFAGKKDPTPATFRWRVLPRR